MKAKLRKLTRLFLLIPGVSVFVSCNNANNTQSGDVPELSVIKVTPVNEQFYETYTATLKGKQDIDIRPQVTGFITRVQVQSIIDLYQALGGGSEE